jgi:hypothetical protein
LTTFAKDLVKRGAVSSVEQAMKMKRLSLATLIMDTYITYPTNMDRVIPVNYCLISERFPALEPLLKLIGC